MHQSKKKKLSVCTVKKLSEKVKPGRKKYIKKTVVSHKKNTVKTVKITTKMGTVRIFWRFNKKNY